MHKNHLHIWLICFAFFSITIHQSKADTLAIKPIVLPDPPAVNKLAKSLSYPYFKKYAHPLLSPFSYHIGGGITAYAGDLSTPPDFENQKNHLTPMVNLGISYRLTHYISLRAEVSGFQLYAEPQNNNDKFVGFKSYNAEGSLVLVHEFIPKSSIENYTRKFSPYLFGGVGGVLFQPRSIADDSDLLSNSDTTVMNYAMVVPVGLGFKYYLHESINIELEGGLRITQTDYLDGNIGIEENTRNDMYFFLGARLTVQFLTKYHYKRHLKRKVKNR
jgi:hypothetical protein